MREMLYRSLARAILICALGVSGLIGYAQSPGFNTVQSEDFNACALPAGWTSNVIAGTGSWQFTTNFVGLLGASIDGTCLAAFDDDAAGSASPPNVAELLSPPVDVTPYTSLTLEFDYNAILGIFGTVDTFRVSVWDGSDWVEVLLEQGFNPGTWPGAVNASIDVTAYINANFQVRFAYSDDGVWGYGVGMDNFSLVGFIPYQYEAVLDFGNGYTQIPNSQIPYPISATALNDGTDPLTNVEVTIELTDGITTLSQTSAPQNLAVGQSFTFDYPGGFAPPNANIWTASAEVTSAEVDDNPINNTVTGVDYVFSDTIYSRDDGISTIALGYNGATGSVGVGYDIYNRIPVAGIELHLGGGGFAPNAGAQGKVLLYDFDDVLGVPGDVIAESDVFTTPAGPTSGLPITINFPETVILEPGRYVAVAEQTTGTFNGIGNAAGIYAGYEDRMWVNFAGNTSAIANDWGPIGAFFAVTPMIRIVESSSCLIVNAGEDTSVCADDVVLLGALDPSGAPDSTAQFGVPPYTYSWTPTTGLDDPSSANPTYTATNTSGSPEVTQFVVTVVDGFGCEESDTVQVTVFPKDTVALFLPTTDYCIDDPADTIDYQPLGGVLSGPGVILVDSFGMSGPVGGGGTGGGGGCNNPASLTGSFAGGNGQNGNMFNIVASNDVEITGFDQNFFVTGNHSFEIYTKAGSHVGFETNAGAWTLVGSGTVNATVAGAAVPLNLLNNPVPISAGQTQAFYLTSTAPVGAAVVSYTNGTVVGGPWVGNADIEIPEGVGNQYPFSTVFSPRNWNGNVYYNLCTGGGSGSGGGSSGSNCVAGGPLTTTFTGGTTGAPAPNGQMFDIEAFTDIEIKDFDVHMSGTDNIEIWTKPGTHVGFEANPSAWTLVTTVPNVTGNGLGVPTPLNTNVSIQVAAGATQALYITPNTSVSLTYSSGGAVGQSWAVNSDLEIFMGSTVQNVGGPGGVQFSPRNWNGTIYYDVCTGGFGGGGGGGSTVTCTPAPPESYPNVPTPVPPTGTSGTNIETFTISGYTGNLGTDVNLLSVDLDISHTFTGDLDIFLESPDGTSIQLFDQHCGGSNDLNITIEPGTSNPISAAPCGAAPAITGTWNAIAGQDLGDINTAGGSANGDWILTIVDNLGGDSGFLNDWTLNFEECTTSGSGGSGPLYVFDPDSAGVGTHDLTYCYTNQYGCTYCDTFTVTVHPLPDPTIDPVVAQCLNGDNIFLTAATPLGTWSGPGIVDPVAGEFDPSAAGIGTHTITYFVMDANGCENIDSIDIVVNDVPIADAGADMTICEGESIAIGGNPTGTPGSDPNGFIDNYNWTPQTGLSSSVDPNPSASPTMTTTYVVQVQDNNGCTDLDTMTVTVHDAPVADAGPAIVTSCNGTPVVIGGSPSATQGTQPYTYTWTPATGLSSTSLPNPMASPAVNTTYTLTVTDANGCMDEATVEVRVTNGPVANAGVDIAVCSDVDVTLGGIPTAAGGNPPYTYSWAPSNNLDDPTIANPTFNATNLTALPVPYSYTVTVTDRYGCESSDVINITLNPAVIVDAGNDREICWGSGTILGGVATATNGVPPYQYNWGPTVGIITPNVAKPNATPTSNTIYTVQVTDDNGCVGEDQVVVIVNPLPIAEAGPDQTVCKGTTTQIGGLPSANGGQAPYKYSWSPYIGLSDDSTANPIAGPSVTETFTLTVVDDNGCIDKDVVTVWVVDNPTAAAGFDKEVCIGNSIEIGAKPAASGGQAPYSFKWTPGGTLDNDTHENPVATPNNVGSTMYILTVYDANNCEDSDSMVVTANPLPEPVITNIEEHYCIDDPIVTLNGDPSGGIFSGNGVSGSTFIPGLAGPGQHEITYTYTDQNGCTNTVSYVVEVHRNPIIYAGPDKTVYLGYSTTLDAESGGVYTYLWDPTIYLDDPNVLNPNVVLPLETTTYMITATDAYGCENSDEVTVFVDINTPLNAPNTFTPNGDGINDTWEIPLIEFFPINNVKIYNRWGQLVHEQDNYSSGNAWDGGDLPEGTYFYVIMLTDQGNTVHRGTVTIVR